jgi:hypothetical protein
MNSVETWVVTKNESDGKWKEDIAAKCKAIYWNYPVMAEGYC